MEMIVYGAQELSKTVKHSSTLRSSCSFPKVCRFLFTTGLLEEHLSEGTEHEPVYKPSLIFKSRNHIADFSVKRTGLSLFDLVQKRTNMLVSDSSGSIQTPSIPSANLSSVTPTPGVTGDAAAIHISEDPRLVEEARIQKKRDAPLLVYQRRLRGKKEQAAAATIEDPAARPNNSIPPELLRGPVESVVPELDLINQNIPEASDLIQKGTNMVMSDSSGSMQTPSVPSADISTVTPTPGVTGNAAAIHISEDARLVKEALIQKKRNVPVESVVPELDLLNQNTPEVSDLLQKRTNMVVSDSCGSMQTPSIPSANLSTVTPTPGVTSDAAAVHIREDPCLVKEAHIQKKHDVPVESVVLELDLINQNTPEESEEILTWKKRATELEERMTILEKEFAAKVQSVEEGADRHILEQQEKIDALTAEKALITQDLEGELKAVSHELEQHKKILEEERARISQFEVEKKKIAVLADVTATYNLLLSFVVAVPDFDYTLLGDDIARKVEDIRLKLAK